MNDTSDNGAKRWSQHVTEHSNALDLEQGVFTWDEPKRIAVSLRDSAERSDRKLYGKPQARASS